MSKFAELTDTALARVRRRVDVNKDNKIDAADAEMILKDAMNDAALYAGKKPLAAMAWAFAAGVILTLLFVSMGK